MSDKSFGNVTNFCGKKIFRDLVLRVGVKGYMEVGDKIKFRYSRQIDYCL